MLSSYSWNFASSKKIPALLKAKFNFPKLLIAVSCRLIISDLIFTSVFTNIPFPPVSLISSTSEFPKFSLLPAATTLIPFEAK